MSFNQVTVVGNLTRDPEVRQLDSGTSVAEIGIAVNSRQKRGEEWVDEVDYFDVTVWGRQAENVGEYLHKGSKVLISGRLKQDRWENEASEKRSKVKIIAREVQFLDSKSDSGGEAAAKPKTEAVAAGAASGGGQDGDIPF